MQDTAFKNTLPAIIAMAATVVVSNILVQYLVGQWLTWGAFTYPIAFLITDLTNRLQGPEAARRVVLVGFVTGLACSFIGTQIMGEFGPLVTWRIALGSGVAFLSAQFLDIYIFQRLRNKSWWRAPLISSTISSSFDTVIFFSIAFSTLFITLEPSNDVSWANEALPLLGLGPVVPLWVSLACADWGVKMAISVISLVPFRIIVKKIILQGV